MNLMDTVIAVAFSLLVIGGIVTLADTIQSTNEISETITGHSQLVSNIQRRHPTGIYTGLTTALVASSEGMAPSPYTTTTTTITAPWGGAVTTVVNSSNARLFDLGYAGVDEDVCVDLLDATATRDNSRLSALSVDSTAFTLPGTFATIQAACDGGDIALSFSYL